MRKVLMWLIVLSSLSYGFATKLAVLPELMNPGLIEIGGNELYILEGVFVYVYSLEDFKLLRKFGKKGEGPGELIPNDEITIQMKILGESVFVNSQSKIIRFSKTGRLIQEKTFPFVAFQIIPSGQNYAVSSIGYTLNGPFLKVMILDKKLKELKTLYSAKGISSPFKGKLLIPPERLYIFRSVDKLLVVDTQKSFQLQLFDLEGNSLTPIKVYQEPIEVTKAIKTEILEWIKGDIRYKGIPEIIKKILTVPSHLPVIRDLVIDNNKIYIQTYRKKKNLTQFFVLNFNGNVLKELWLPPSSGDIIKLTPNRTYTIHDNKYYYLIENMEKEVWELYVEDIK